MFLMSPGSHWCTPNFPWGHCQNHTGGMSVWLQEMRVRIARSGRGTLLVAPCPWGIIAKVWAPSAAGLLLLYASEFGVHQGEGAGAVLLEGAFYVPYVGTSLSTAQGLSSYHSGTFTALSLQGDCPVPVALCPASAAVAICKVLLAAAGLHG